MATEARGLPGASYQGLTKDQMAQYPVAQIPKDEFDSSLTSEDVAKIIPTDVDASTKTGVVMKRIADRSFQYVMQNSPLKNNSLVQSANSLQEKMKADIVVPPSAPGETAHKLTFQYEIFQSLAKLEYSGWLKAIVNMNIQASESDIIIKERVFSDKDLYLQQKVSASTGTTNSLGLSWSW